MESRRRGGSVLVTGAAGKTGRAVIRELARHGVEVNALVHRPSHHTVVEELGARRIFTGDLADSEAVAAAAEGVQAIYHICPNVHPDEVGIGRKVIDAARHAGARRLIYHSVLHPQVEAMPHHWAKMRVEELLFESGLDFTILQPAPYMQNVLAQWRSIRDEGVYAVPYAIDTRVAMVDLEDVAEAARRVLIEPGHVAATYELCGPDRLDQREIAVFLGRAVGKPVRAETVTLKTWAERARAGGMGAQPLETLLAMFRYYERHGMAGNPRVLESLLDRPATGFSEFVGRIRV